MAEAEGKSGDEASLMKAMSDNTAAGEKVEESKSSLKSSWSGWFQKMNDAVLGAIDGESKEESKEENKEEVTNSNEEQKAGSWGAWGTSLLQQAKEKVRLFCFCFHSFGCGRFRSERKHSLKTWVSCSRFLSHKPQTNATIIFLDTNNIRIGEKGFNRIY